MAIHIVAHNGILKRSSTLHPSQFAIFLTTCTILVSQVTKNQIIQKKYIGSKITQEFSDLELMHFRLCGDFLRWFV